MKVKLAEKQKIQLGQSEDVYSIMKMVLLRENKIDRDKEHFWVIGMTNNNMIQNIELVTLDSVKKTVVEPMNVFRVPHRKTLHKSGAHIGIPTKI